MPMKQTQQIALDDAIQQAARDLPDGWEIRISIENGSGCVDLYDEEGAPVGDGGPADCDETFASCILRLVELAKNDGDRRTA